MVDFVAKVKIEIIVSQTMVDLIVEKITEAARTGKIGEGKIFISEVEGVIRVRTGERGDDAICILRHLSIPAGACLSLSYS